MLPHISLLRPTSTIDVLPIQCTMMSPSIDVGPDAQKLLRLIRDAKCK